MPQTLSQNVMASMRWPPLTLLASASIRDKSVLIAVEPASGFRIDAALMQSGRYAAAYLGLGLQRYGSAGEGATGSGDPAEDPAW